MPSWTDEGGNDWFGKLQCKRCLQKFDAVEGEVPIHRCHGGWFTSKTTRNEFGFATHHDPVQVKDDDVPKSAKKKCAKR